MTRINFTGRRRISQDRVDVQLNTIDAPPTLTARIDLTGVSLSGDAHVILEVYRPATYQYQRHDLGELVALPSAVPISLEAFDDPSSVLVRLKVVSLDAKDGGKILAEADKVRPQSDTDSGGRSRQGLLDIQPSDDLGHRVWRLDIAESPVLLVNRGVGDWNAFAREKMFISLVYPQVLEFIVDWLIESDLDSSDENEPVASWAGLVRRLGFDPESVDRDDRDARRLFAGDVVDAFVSRYKILDLVQSTDEGHDS